MIGWDGEITRETETTCGVADDHERLNLVVGPSLETSVLRTYLMSILRPPTAEDMICRPKLDRVLTRNRVGKGNTRCQVVTVRGELTVRDAVAERKHEGLGCLVVIACVCCDELRHKGHGSLYLNRIVHRYGRSAGPRSWRVTAGTGRRCRRAAAGG